ncbi:MAG: response regulator [Symploca sp. SIO3E6]|nr:response regulator [Caldora sp. SIO3E6]
MIGHQINILLVEDNPGDAFLIRDMLQQARMNQFELTHIEQLGVASQYLETNSFDAILLDLSLPDSKGLNTLAAIEEKASSLPIVVLTGMNDEEVAIQAVRQGAQDYLVKGQVNTEVLVRSIRYAIERQQLEENLKQRSLELEAANKELESFSYTVSHDLRNHLTNIDCFNSLLAIKYGNRLNEEGMEYVEHVHQAIRQMNHLIQDLLKLSVVKYSQIEFEQINLSPIVQEILAKLQQRQPSRSAEFLIAAKILAQGSEPLLKIVLENLLENAWKYTNKQQITKIEFGAYPLARNKPALD